MHSCDKMAYESLSRRRFFFLFFSRETRKCRWKERMVWSIWECFEFNISTPEKNSNVRSVSGTWTAITVILNVAVGFSRESCDSTLERTLFCKRVAHRLTLPFVRFMISDSSSSSADSCFCQPSEIPSLIYARSVEFYSEHVSTGLWRRKESINVSIIEIVPSSSFQAYWVTPLKCSGRDSIRQLQK